MTLAKGLTGAHMPLGAVVLARAVARTLEHEMLYTGLTYCGHPLSCAAGVAAMRAYEDGNLIERSRALGSSCSHACRRCRSSMPCIGDVRGGHGLFAVVELVRDRATREPLAPWPQTPPALQQAGRSRARAAGVSFATRGNLILLAPPLVIEENELADALAPARSAAADCPKLKDGIDELQTDLRDDVQPARRRCTSASRRRSPTSTPGSARRHAVHRRQGRRGARNFAETATARSTAQCCSAASRWPTPPRRRRRWPPRTRRSRPGARRRRRAHAPDAGRRRR